MKANKCEGRYECRQMRVKVNDSGANFSDGEMVVKANESVGK